jgi:hypothetical protein
MAAEDCKMTECAFYNLCISQGYAGSQVVKECVSIGGPVTVDDKVYCGAKDASFGPASGDNNVGGDK